MRHARSITAINHIKYSHDFMHKLATSIWMKYALSTCNSHSDNTQSTYTSKGAVAVYASQRVLYAVLTVGIFDGALLLDHH